MALVAAAGCSNAAADERTIAFYNIHTKETLQLVYKKDGKYLPDALERINWIMRDWRQNEQIKMDPELIDLLWEVHSELGSSEPIHVICGYRSRETNEMLRRTVGGQASQSRHILGKAADVQFPDVPLKRLRYSGLIHERGGVGYYPTSAIPFVHLDTDRVRHWPRLPRHELALLFPDGRTKHVPADGGPITRQDVEVARVRHNDLAQQITAFFEDRNKQRTSTLIASAKSSGAHPVALARLPAKSPQPAQPEQKVAVLASEATLPLPKLKAEPRLVDPPSRFTKGPSDGDRVRLDQLVTLASFQAPAVPALLAAPKAAERKRAPAPTPAPTMASLTGGSLPGLARLRQNLYGPAAPSPALARVATNAPVFPPGEPPRTTHDDVVRFDTRWAQESTFDDDHPEELSYHPFPVAALLTETASLDDPVLARMEHPDVARTVGYIGDEGSVPPVRMRPGRPVAQTAWAQQFLGVSVGYATLTDAQGESSPPPGFAQRVITTSAR